MRFTPRWFELYRRTTHLRTEISEADHRALFETIWRDRTTNAGWNAAFTCQGDDVVLTLTRVRVR